MTNGTWNPLDGGIGGSKYRLAALYEAQLQVNEEPDPEAQLAIARAALEQYRPMVAALAEALKGERVTVEAGRAVLLMVDGDHGMYEAKNDVAMKGSVRSLANLNLGMLGIPIETSKAELAFELTDVEMWPLDESEGPLDIAMPGYPLVSGIRRIKYNRFG